MPPRTLIIYELSPYFNSLSYHFFWFPVVGCALWKSVVSVVVILDCAVWNSVASVAFIVDCALWISFSSEELFASSVGIDIGCALRYSVVSTVASVDCAFSNPTSFSLKKRDMPCELEPLNDSSR